MAGVPIDILCWTVEVDVPRTITAYEQLEVGVPCDCDNCSNFDLVGADAFPARFHEVFEMLGVDFRKPAEIVYHTKLDSGLHMYGGWYHFVGRIIQGRNLKTGSAIELESLDGDAEIGFSAEIGLPRESFSGSSLVQMEIGLQLPWLL